MHYLRRTFRRHLLCKPAEDGSDLGGAPDTSTSTVVDTPADTGAVVADTSGPTSMLEAMSSALEPAAGGLDAAGQPRDPLGRFAPKNADGTPVTPAVDAAGKPASAPGAPAAPGATPPVVPPVEDLTAMPEGLTPKAQERFQKLANANKEHAEWRAQVEPQINYIQETFQSNGIQREQFQTFVEFAGALNRGDVATAQRIMQTEMQNLALLTGQPLTADPLASHPDLREAVDGFEITEARALEMARFRTQQAQQQAQAQQHQQAQQTQQQAQQKVQQAEQQIDQLMTQLQSSDIDYPSVMPHLEQAIKDGLLAGVDPSQWAPKLQAQYQLIKKVAGSQRTVQPATPVLRPTGVAAPGQQPKSMLDAMFPNR